MFKFNDEQIQPPIQNIQLDILNQKKIKLDILRLDTIHPEISGNKWFKLKYNLQQAQKEQATQILSFGGAYSNHLHALAFTGKLNGFKTIGIVRGEKVSNATLNDCRQWGMQLKFITRDNYRQKNNQEFLVQLKESHPNTYIIPEGGDNELGILGCKEIIQAEHSDYDYITCSVGTGTTLSGIIESKIEHQHVIGFSALKGATYLTEQIASLVKGKNWNLNHDFHFGGFGKAPLALLDFITWFQKKTHIELDKVYTAKMMYGLVQLIQTDHFKSNTKILCIHTGGLQGNRS